MLRSGALIRAPDQSSRSKKKPLSPRSKNIESLIDQQTFYSRDILLELTQSPRGQHTFCDRKLLSELIDSPSDEKLLAIRSSYQSSLTPLIDQKTCCDRELLSELIVTPINKSIESLIDQQNFLHFFLTHWSTDKLLAVRSSYQSLLSPNQTKTSCDQELLSEPIDSLIDQQTCYDRELLSELIVTPIDKHWISDWPTNFLQSRALTRSHSVPERTTHVFRSEGLIRAHWLPDRWKTTCDQELLSELIDSPDRPKNLLWSGALIRAHCHPDQQIH